MKKIDKRHLGAWLLMASLVIGGNCFGQIVKHHSFTVYYNASIKAPDSVSWDLNASMVNCGVVPRVDKFAQDKEIPGSPKPSDFVQLPEYKTDKTVEGAKGHLKPYEESRCNPIDNTECFLVDQMYWQYQNFNAGDWKTVEAYEQGLALKENMHIIAGYIGIAQRLPTGIPIVSYMYKAIYHNGAWECFIMPNMPTTKGHKYDYWHVSVTELDSKTGLKL